MGGVAAVRTVAARPAADRGLRRGQPRAARAYHRLLVWKASGVVEGPQAHGPLCLAYEEVSDGLDGTELSRYWLLSEGWRWDHSPCVSNRVATVAVAQSLGVRVVGQDVPLASLLQLETGKKLAPDVAQKRQRLWHPNDLITPLPGTETPWRQAMWKDAQGWLAGGKSPSPQNADAAQISEAIQKETT